MRTPPAIIPGTVDSHGTTLNTVSWSSNPYQNRNLYSTQSIDVYVRDRSINYSWDLPLESSSGKLSWKYVGSQLKRMKKQLFWQKWQIAQALKYKEKVLIFLVISK